MDVTLPDGTVIQGVPDNISKAELTAKLQSNGYDVSKLAPQSTQTKSTYGDFARTLNDSLKAAGKATSGQSQLGRGFQDVLDSAALGTAWARDKLGGSGNYDAVKADINAINQDYEQAVPNGSGLRVASNIVATLPVGGLLAKAVGGGGGALPTALRTGGMSTGAVLPEGAKWLGAKGADMALRTAAAGAVGTAGGAMINPDEALKAGGISALMPAGFKVAGAAGQFLGKSPKVELNSVKRAAAENAMNEGFVVAPSQVNPSFGNRLMEGLAGKHATEQAVSIKNAEKANELSRSYLGLPKDADLTASTLSKYKADQYAKGYEPIKELGAIQVGDDFNKSLDAIANKYKGKGTIPAIEKTDITELTNAFKSTGFDSGDAIDAIRILRDNADEAYRKGDKAFGKANKDIANEFENAIDNHLYITGQSDILKAYRDARQNIAKSYTVGKAIKEGTGGVEASKIGAAVTKNPDMIKGEMRTLGEFANAFPKSVRSPESIGSPQVNALRTMLGLGFGAGTSGLGGAVIGAVAPSAVQSGVNSIMFNQAVQRRLLNNKANGNGLFGLLQEPAYRFTPAIAAQ
jgi:hypothetical protein